MNAWTRQVIQVVQLNWRGMLWPLLRGSVVPAVLASGCVLSVTALVEGWVIGDGIEEVLNIVLLLIMLPLTAWGSAFITGSWVQALQAASKPEGKTETGDEATPGTLRGAYLTAFACLLAIAAAVPYLITNLAAPIHLGNIPGAGFVIAFAGPLGLLAPLALLAPRAIVGRHQASSQPAVTARTAVIAVVAVGYGLAIGLGAYGLAVLLQADGFVALVALIANLLNLPLLIFLISASAADSPYSSSAATA